MVSQRRLPFDTVAIENRAGARALAEALVALGHRRFAVLTGPSTLLAATDRLAGFRQGLAAHGVELHAGDVITDEFTRDGGYHAMRSLLAQRSDATCVFAVNDVMAVGAMSAARDAGLRLPHDLAVAGFDDIETLRDVAPRLTTVRVDLDRLGREGLEMALAPRAETPRLKRLKCEVVVRESTPSLTGRGR
jgi:LacI family transcriptional regulator